MFVVGLSGKARSGKNEVCDALMGPLSEAGLGSWEEEKFAEPVKNIVARAFKISVEELEKHKTTKTRPEGWKKDVRDAYIHVGNGFRDFDEDVWIKHLAARRGLAPRIADACHQKQILGNNLFLTDVRYKNEVEWIRSIGGIVVRIHRPGVELIDSESEKNLDDWTEDLLEKKLSGPIAEHPFTYLLINDGSLEELRLKIEERLAPFVVDRLKFMLA